MDGGGNLFLVFEGTEKSGLFFFLFFYISGYRCASRGVRAQAREAGIAGRYGRGPLWCIMIPGGGPRCGGLSAWRGTALLLACTGKYYVGIWVMVFLGNTGFFFLYRIQF